MALKRRYGHTRTYTLQRSIAHLKHRMMNRKLWSFTFFLFWETCFCFTLFLSIQLLPCISVPQTSPERSEAFQSTVCRSHLLHLRVRENTHMHAHVHFPSLQKCSVPVMLNKSNFCIYFKWKLIIKHSDFSFKHEITAPVLNLRLLRVHSRWTDAKVSNHPSEEERRIKAIKINYSFLSFSY